ncbi:MAG: hypothetical protein JRJ12_03360 [Deltaproteobacteria bacterium]|nr:hypothetical protein [Deltaproteobacteria bacterium]MBW2070267.1 hypothetical protein [Deltaproteobacteria bacterium]
MADRLKPTSAALQLFGAYASRNVITLTAEELQELWANRKLPQKFPVSPGYVIVRLQEEIVGCGLYLGDCLFSQFSKNLFMPQTWECLERG